MYQTLISMMAAGAAAPGGGGSHTPGIGTITFVSESAIAYGAPGLDVTYPASISAGNLLLMLIVQKRETATVATPSGWTLLGSATNLGGYGAWGGVSDVGNSNVYAYYTTASGSESGTLNVTHANSAPIGGMMMQFSKSGGTWDLAATTGEDTDGGNLSVTFGSDIGVVGGDYVASANVFATDGQNQSATAYSQTGVTFGTVTQTQFSTTSSTDMSGATAHAPVSSGTSSAAPVITATTSGSANARGGAIFVRIRAV
jgi:hypothetical protein